MNEKRTENLLIVIRSLIAISVGMVVAMLVLALAFWLQSQLVESLRHDSVASITSFLIPFLAGGLATGMVCWTRRKRVALLHGLLFALLYQSIFLWGWIQSDEIGAGLITGLSLGGLLLAGLGSVPGHWLRLRLLRRLG